MKDFIKILLGAVAGIVVWQMLATNGFALPSFEQPQRMTPPQVQIVYPTTEPAQVQIIQPTWAPPTAVPTATSTATPATVDAGPQRAEQGNERGCASTRSCD